jgi:chemotaxis response regulator CheB
MTTNEPAAFTLTREDLDRAHEDSKPTDRTRVLVADPDQLARRALTDSLRSSGSFTVVAQASDGVEAVELARHYRPSVVLIATGLSGLDVAAACEQIVRADAEIRVVVLATAPTSSSRCVWFAPARAASSSRAPTRTRSRSRWPSSAPATRSSPPS